MRSPKEITADCAKKKLQEIQEFSKVLEAAIAGKTVQFREINSNAVPITFDYPDWRGYEIKKEKVMVYNCLYYNLSFSKNKPCVYSSTDKETFDKVVNDLQKQFIGTNIFVSEVEV